MSENLLRFGSHRDALRSEDEPLLTGRGRFTDDIDVPGQAHAAFVRAQVAHAELRGTDVSRPLKMPGVIGVFTGRDLAADGLGAIPPLASLPGRGGTRMFGAAMPALAVDRVRYVGESIAIVVAETAAQARDAVEAVIVELAELPASTASRAWAAVSATTIAMDSPP